MTGLRDVIGRMDRDKRFDVTFSEHPVWDDDDFADWDDWLHRQPGLESYRSPGFVSEIYGVTGGFDLHWRYHPDGPDLLSGYAGVVSLFGLYRWDEEHEIPVAELLTERRQFDIATEDMTGAVCLLDTCGEVGSMVLREDGATTPLPSGIGPVEYLLWLVEWRAVEGWQRTLVGENMARLALPDKF
uniref:hypothetical protein n=1 Tax=Paractinoplanes polyasparticus TaxID=2856853 RepID=UPI001C84D328|nr:hypothetical protein [Actinoplanes polyasparticus]